MYNKKVLIDALKKLDSAKAPAVKKDIIVNPFNQMGVPTMKRGGQSVNKYSKLSKFLEGGGNPTCPKDYKWNPETNRCEKKTGCPDHFTFDLKSGRCVSNFNMDPRTLKYSNLWPKDLNLEDVSNPVYFPQVQQRLRVSHPDYKNKWDNTITEIDQYPDLNYKVVVDPSKPEGFNKNENIYYVKSENTHQARKYKEWEQLKAYEKQNIQKLTDAGFYIERNPDGSKMKEEEGVEPTTMGPKATSDYYTNEEDIVDADGTIHLGGRKFKEGWDEAKYQAEKKRPQEFYNDPEYLGHVPQNVSYEDFYKERPGTVKESYNYRCKDCSYGHGERYKVGDDYLYRTTNLSSENIYADPTIESMYPKLEFEEGVDRPDYYPSDYDMKIPTIGIGTGETKSKKHTKRLFNGKGQKYSWTTYRQTKDLDFGTREATRLIPRMVQKATGYDRNFMEGYEDKKGNYFPGEIEKAEEEGRQINFKGASSLRDRKQQKIYNEKWTNSEEENKLIRQQNEDLLKEYGLNREEYVKLYGEFKYGGGLNKFVEGGMSDPGDITCPKDYTFNLATNKCEKNSSICPKGYDINKKTGKCVLIVGEPGFIKNNLGEWVQDVEGKTVVTDKNDTKYKDYLIRKHLSDISKVNDWDIRSALFYELSNSINNPPDPADNYRNYYEEFYNPETGYDFSNSEKYTLSDINKGDYGSRVQLFNNLTNNKYNTATAKKFLNDQGFPIHDKFNFNANQDYDLKNYTPDSYIGRAGLDGRDLTVSLFAVNSPMSTTAIANSTPVIEDEINRARLKMFFPDITDEDINKHYKYDSDQYISNNQGFASINKKLNFDIPFKDFVAATKKWPDIQFNSGTSYFKPESIDERIRTDFEILPNYSEPIDKFILKKTLDDVYPTSMIEQADPSVELYTNPDAPEYSPSYPENRIGYDKYNWNSGKNVGMGTKWTLPKRQPKTGGFYDKMSKKVEDLKNYMEGYDDKDGNYIPGEREKAEEEGRQINFQGRTSLKDRRAQKDYNQKWTQYQIDKDLIKKQNIDLLEKYGLSTEEYLANYKKYGGALSKFTDGGEPCPEGYAFNPKTGECIEWNPTVWESNDEPTSYDPVGDIIYMNPNDRSPDMTDDQYKQFYNNELQHEQLHRLQWVNGELKGRTGTPLRMPSTVDNQNYDGDHYYNRRSEEESDLGNYWMNTHPNEAPFIPGDMLYNKEINPALYDTPGMSEWEARDYEYATDNGMPSLFPKRKQGGNTEDYEVIGRSEHNAPAIGDYPEKEVNVKKSNIHGKGLFAEEPIRAGEIIGLSHVKTSYSKDGNEYMTSNATPILGAYHNHSENTNTESILEGNKRYLKAIRDIQVGEEITSDYTSIDDPTLEKPEHFGNDFKNGGSSRSRLPNRRNEKAYSRSLEATNKLFAVHPFFAKAKSRKNKIYDPNAKYYAEGGEPTSPEEWGQQIKDIEGQIGNPSGWTLSDYNTLQNKLNEYKSWRENTPEGQAVIDTHNEEREYDIPLPEHLQDYTNAMMKARLAYANEFGNPAAKRMINIPDNPYQFDNGDTGTHYMASMDNYAVPQIQDENGQLMLGDYGPDSREAMRFDSDEDANYFAENYKDVSPGFLNQKQYGRLNKFVEGGALPKANSGLGIQQSLSYSPFSYNMPISLAGNTTFNPSQSINYTNPHFGSGILNMFNKKLAKGAYGSPLELSLGRPYFTDDESLTNSSLDYSKPWQPDIEHYNYIKTNAGFNGWENTIYQNIGDSLGVDPNLLTSSDLKKYAAKEALATIKPQYKPGKPIDFNLKYSLLGMRQSTTNPVRGFGSLNVGYNPDSGWYGGGEGGAYGVIAKHMTPETYLRRGLKKKGDWAFIPSLSLGVGIRQKVGYGNEVNDKVKIYQSILEKDAQNGTANAEDYYSDHLSNGLNSHMNYGFRPELKFLYKPAKHFSGILGAKVGVGADLLGGREGQMNEIKANYSPYGEVSFSIPIEDQVQRLKKKIKNFDLPSPSRKYYEEEDYDEGTVDEETETETETNEEPAIDEDIQINYDGQGVGKANCRDGYERPCEKCKCQKIKLPTPYTDKRGTHLFGNEPIRFKQGGEQNYINAQLSQKEIDKYIKDGYVIEEVSNALPKANEGLEVALKKGKTFLTKLTKLGKLGKTAAVPLSATLLNNAREISTILPTINTEQISNIVNNAVNTQTRPLSHSDQMVQILNNQVDAQLVSPSVFNTTTPAPAPALTYEEYLQLSRLLNPQINPQTNQYEIPFEDFTTPQYTPFTVVPPVIVKPPPLSEIDLKNMPLDFDPQNVTFPFQVKGDSGFMQLGKSNYGVDDNQWNLLTRMENPFESGRAMNLINKVFPKPFPSILEKTSLSLDSFNALLNMGKRNKDWDIKYENDITLNNMARHSKLFDDIIPGTTGSQFLAYGYRTAPQSDIDKAVDILNEDIFKKGFSEKAYFDNGDFKIPNYRLTRKYNEGGETDYELGDEVDEETKQYLESIGYTFETI